MHETIYLPPSLPHAHILMMGPLHGAFFTNHHILLVTGFHFKTRKIDYRGEVANAHAVTSTLRTTHEFLIDCRLSRE